MAPEAPDAELEHKVDALLPVTVHQRPRSDDDVLTRVLRRAGENLALVAVERSPKGSRNLARWSRLSLGAVVRHAGDLEQHRGNVVARVQQLHVDVHVVRDEALALLRLLLLRLLLKLVVLNSLREKLLLPPAPANLTEARVRRAELRAPERSEANLGLRPVEEHLIRGVDRRNVLLRSGAGAGGVLGEPGAASRAGAEADADNRARCRRPTTTRTSWRCDMSMRSRAWR